MYDFNFNFSFIYGFHRKYYVYLSIPFNMKRTQPYTFWLVSTMKSIEVFSLLFLVAAVEVNLTMYLKKLNYITIQQYLEGILKILTFSYEWINLLFADFLRNHTSHYSLIGNRLKKLWHQIGEMIRLLNQYGRKTVHNTYSNWLSSAAFVSTSYFFLFYSFIIFNLPVQYWIIFFIHYYYFFLHLLSLFWNNLGFFRTCNTPAARWLTFTFIKKIFFFLF